MNTLFPSADSLARAFYQEAVRHLSDAYCLHKGGSAAGAITSAMKAAELGAKSVLILHNALGIYAIFNTHKPYTKIENHPVLKQLGADLDAYRSNLAMEVREMEKLEPTQFGDKNFGPEEANTEYPFLLKMTDPKGAAYAEINRPETYFTAADSPAAPGSLHYCRIAHELLVAVASLEPMIGSWQVALPPRL